MKNSQHPIERSRPAAPPDTFFRMARKRLLRKGAGEHERQALPTVVSLLWNLPEVTSMFASPFGWWLARLTEGGMILRISAMPQRSGKLSHLHFAAIAGDDLRWEDADGRLRVAVRNGMCDLGPAVDVPSRTDLMVATERIRASVLRPAERLLPALRRKAQQGRKEALLEAIRRSAVAELLGGKARQVPGGIEMKGAGELRATVEFTRRRGTSVFLHGLTSKQVGDVARVVRRINR